MSMKRSQIYLTEQQKKRLDELSDARNVSKSELIREAIDRYIVTVSSENDPFVDCVSFAWLQEHEEVEFLSFDRHFYQMGFQPFEA